MIDYEPFSSLRLEVLFPQQAQFLLPDKSGGSWECYGGLWEMDEIEGVEFGFPEIDPTKLGFIHLDHSTGDDIPDFCNPEDRPDGILYRKPQPSHRKTNCSEILELLQFPIPFGSTVADFERVFPGVELLNQHRDERLGTTFFQFFTAAPSRYLCSVIFSDKIGMTRLELAREDLRESNASLSESSNSDTDQD